MNVRRLVLGELETNCYLVWSDKGDGLVIDPADEIQQILAAIEQEGVTVKAVVLTHAHFDHMLAAEALCQHTGAPLYVGVGDADALTDPVRNLSGLFTPGQEVTLPVDHLLREGDTLTVGDMRFAVMETPGHTPGCLCLLSGDVLFSGDTLFRGSIGRLDFPGGDAAAMRRSLKRLMELPESVTVYSGHGPATTIGWEKNHNPYLN